MAAIIAEHPEREKLVAYGLGKLADSDSVQIENHLDACSLCLAFLANLDSDSFLHNLQKSHRILNIAMKSTRTGVNSTGTDVLTSSEAYSASFATSRVGSSIGDDPLNHPNYETKHVIGAGGMGEIYLARHKLLNRWEALKTIRKEIVEKPGTMDRFKREIQSAARLNHPNVVSAYNAFEHNGQLIFSMEFVDGSDLAKLIQPDRPFSVNRACFFFVLAANGLSHAHENKLVHRDIKPSNLICFRQGKKWGLKLLDFGLAKAMSEETFDGHVTAKGAMLGTLMYIAPEQARGAEHADIRSDIYSLGCSLYHVLAGRPPFVESNAIGYLEAHLLKTAEPLHLIRNDVPVELSQIVSRMIAKSPADRFQEPKEVAQALKGFVKPGSKKRHHHSEAPRIDSDFDFGRDQYVILPDDNFSSHVEDAGSSARIRRGTVRKKNEGMQIRLLVALAFAALLFWVMLSPGITTNSHFNGAFSGDQGTIILNYVPALSDIIIDGKTVQSVPIGNSEPIEESIATGSHSVIVKRAGFTTFGQHFDVRSGDRISVNVEMEPLVAPLPVLSKTATEPSSMSDGELFVSDIGTSVSVDGFVPLFNRKDLNGWTTHFSQPGIWRVSDDHTIVGWSNRGASHMYSVREYGNFHLRVEARVNDGGNSGIYFRSSASPEFPNGENLWPDGYEAQISNVFPVHGSLLVRDEGIKIGLGDTTVGADEWFLMEVVAVDNHFLIKVNGIETARYEDRGSALANGRIALQVFHDKTVVEFRKIEIKELPPEFVTLDDVEKRESSK
ncbi:MAG: hypothetical protein CMJ46_05430 [Planctomyces sp.]|nr:hypothetical protein [Planctomyces sp.]